MMMVPPNMKMGRKFLCTIVTAGWLTALMAFGADKPAVSPTASPNPKAIDTSGFRDSANHWRHIKEPARVMQPLPDQPAYEPAQVREIAANLLLFQRANGGWPKDYDMLAILTDEQKAAIRASHDRNDTSFDNHTTHPQVEYLARAYSATGDPAYRDACLRGFDFMLAAQHASGGFPQRWPNPKNYYAHITFNDGVMIGILEMLKDAADGQPHFKWLDAARRDRAGEEIRRGIECILKCQIHVSGTPTGWCQQHDEETFQPASARTFELPSICPQETTEILHFLMRLESPGADVVRAVDAAVQWLQKSKLSGIRVDTVPAPHAEFFRHNTDSDRVVVADPKAPPIWARNYEVNSNRPIFAGRDGVKVYSLAEVDRERRTGQPWYGTWPAKLLDRDYPNWSKSVVAHP